MGNGQNKTSKETANATAAAGVNASNQPSVSSTTASKLDSGFSAALNSATGKTALNEEDFTNNIFTAIPTVGRYVYWYLSSMHSAGNSTVPVDKSIYVTGGTNILSLSTAGDQMKFYVKIVTHGKDVISHSDMKTLLTVSQQAAWMSVGLHISPAELSDKHLEAITKSLFIDNSSVSLSHVSNWSFQLCQNFTATLHTYVCSCLIDKKESFAVKEASNELVRMLRDGHSLVEFSSVWMLTCLLPPSFFPCFSSYSLMPLSKLAVVAQNNTWHSLYNSNSHGLSINRFQHHVMEYLGHTLLFIMFDQYVYAAAIDTQWIDSTQRWGGVDGMFIQIQPNYRLIQKGEDLIYFNLSGRTAPKGLHIGKTARTTFLKVDDELSKVNHYGVDLNLAAIEVWGCGGQDRLDELFKQKQWEYKEVTKNQSRKLIPDDWRDNPDRAVLEMGGVTTEHSQRTDI